MKKYVKNLLIFALFLTALGGFGLHYRLHPFEKHAFGYLPFFTGLLSVFLVPILFYFRKTLNLAYLINGFTVIVGLITMAHFSIVKSPILPDIAFLLIKFFIGRAIFCVEVFQMEGEMKFPGWKWFRYPNDGFFLVHLVVLSVVYTLGNMLWR